MCGIAGIVDVRGTREIDRVILKRMTDAIRHRGPDGEGFFTAPGVGFGHRRLAIIDLEGGAQPFESQNRKGVLNFNGEIYNYKTLARDLASSGVPLRTRSDTEALAEGLARHGHEFIHKLRGMFAFAYWDTRHSELLLCRDRIGEKPLYYALSEDGFLIFASEIGALAASGLIGLELDREAVADYFLYGFVPDPKSIYRSIRKLEPGALLTVRRGGDVRVDCYWRPSFEPAQSLTYEAAQEELLARLDDAVRAEMVADVPLGAFLSGGVDSSAIVSSMAAAGGVVNTCSIGFENERYDERGHARLISKLYDTEHHEEIARLDAADLIDRIAGVFGEPFADSSALPTYLVAKMARWHVTVALSGDGGDEVFAGYRRYPFFVNEEKLRALAPLPLRQATFGAVGAAYPKLDWAPRPLRLKTTLQSLGATRAQAYAYAMAANLPDRINNVLSHDFRAALEGYDPVSVVEAAIGPDNSHPLVLAQRVDFATWLPGRMLTKVDRASMAHGLEVRPPLLDAELVQWAGGLSPAYKLNNGAGKRILKSALESRLPREILYREKQGFELPVAEWLRAGGGPLSRLMESDAWRQSGILDERAIRTMARAHQRGVSDCSQELWTIIMFDAFLRAA